jgi:hypothetical protein
VFDQPAFSDFPFYVILGNHDHYGNATAQLEYGQQKMGSGRWNFPALDVDNLYYKIAKEFTDPAGNAVTVDVFMLDTVQDGASRPNPWSLIQIVSGNNQKHGTNGTHVCHTIMYFTQKAGKHFGERRELINDGSLV